MPPPSRWYMDLVEGKIFVYDATGKRMSFGGKDCGAVMSLKIHTTTSGNKLLKVSCCFESYIKITILYKGQLPYVQIHEYCSSEVL